MPLLAVIALAGCAERFSADEYASRAVQQANPVQQGVVAGFRRVAISPDGTAGATAGAAAGGVVGGAAGGNRVTGALGAVGGALVGGLVGSAAERATANTDAIEYVVRRTNGELVSVTQRDATPLPIGTRVLVITGNQARVVVDYTAPGEAPPATAAAIPAAPATPVPTSAPAMGNAMAPLPVAPPPVVPAPPRPADELPPISGPRG
jgi:outer membrane lipoprotein SlyB